MRKLKEFEDTVPNGTRVRFYPDWETKRGNHYQLSKYILELEGESEGKTFRARMKVEFMRHGVGDDMELFMVITADQGKPLEVRGKKFAFEMKDSKVSFVPEQRDYRITNLAVEGYTLEVTPLTSLRLTCVEIPPPGEVDI